MSNEKPKFTPWPWKTDEYGDVFGADETLVCDVYTTEDDPRKEDISLIEKAPELFDSEEKNLVWLLCLQKLLRDGFEIKKSMSVMSSSEIDELTRRFNANMENLEKRIRETDALLKKAKGETDGKS